MPQFDSLRDEPLHEDEAAKLRASVDAIANRTGSKRAKAVGIAALYVENNQNAAAFDVLQDLISSGNDLVDVYYYLGEVYENANQFNRAEENYKIAVRLASARLYVAKAGLARVATPNREQTRLQEAKTAFEALQKITDDDFVPVQCENEEQKSYIVDILGQLVPGTDCEAGERPLILLILAGRCGDCGPGQAKDLPPYCVFC